MKAQCIATIGYICPESAGKPPIVVKQQIQGVIDPCVTVVLPGVPDPTPLSIDSCAVDIPSPAEVGLAYVTPTFTVTYTGTPSSVVLTDNQGNAPFSVPLPATSFQSPYTYQLLDPGNLQFTITADTDVECQINIAAQCRQMIGWTANPGPYTEADILGLTELFSQVGVNAMFSQTLSPDDGVGGASGGVYVVHAYCDSLGPRDQLQYSIGGAFPGGFTETQTGLIVNGAVYRVARTNLGQHNPAGTLYVGT